MFEIGKEYHRQRDIHDNYGGQRRGGISTPKGSPFIFLITGNSGEAFGYSDHFDGNDMYLYTGEGQVGDMQMNKGNAAILKHQQNEKQLVLFEQTKKAYVRCVGFFEYEGHSTALRPDRNGDWRNAIIFQLRLEESNDPLLKPIPKSDLLLEPKKNWSLERLRKSAIHSSESKPNSKERLAIYRNRSQAIKLYTKNRANGVCEGCKRNAPFNTKYGPYLEVHHLTRLADGGPDHPANVIALCPNCHREAHYSKSRRQFNAKLSDIANSIEAQTPIKTEKRSVPLEPA
ncbi:HNH endonuclease [Ferrimonas aestuarii]|uniref:HNH endonuclease n=1 Tax=Ferrimonas aestuarii TaxID=2569539 RepID=A0A4U1BQY7_9GAMM|nr:HNH endonuclease signature motif containing protein [Ferrimonas aestuarii]TKB56772.1 HNH endonuclease [Ferrimonas aestuarii]